MASNLPHHEVSQEENLLIEAVSLLVQRQRDAEERTAALEARLAALESQLSANPSRPATERLTLLREQLDELRSDSSLRTIPHSSPTPLEARRQPAPVSAPSEAQVESVAAPARVSDQPSTWGVFGATPRQRFSLVLIAVGLLALLYSAFLLIHFG